MSIEEECERKENCKKERELKIQGEIKEERKKRMRARMRSLVVVWLELVRLNLIDAQKFTFNKAIATKAITHYISDLEILKARYGIKGNAQAPKLAGLIAANILKYRPIVPSKGNEEGIEDNRANEILAIFQGLCLCTNYYCKSGATVDKIKINDSYNQTMKELLLKKSFNDWHKKLMHLVSERNYSPEGLIMIFETLNFTLYPDRV